ncbi:MAG: hypothetical protein WDN67_05155 [Candidatus Moraniibacteriota bacterium]
MQVRMHAVFLGPEEQKPQEGQSGPVKYYGIFHQPKSGDNSPIKVRFKDKVTLQPYAPYIIEAELRKWEMTNNGQSRSGITITAEKVVPEK